jgi:aldehyde:ferredoxin oxidoreductase
VLELPGYEPRSTQALALGFAVGTRGADHNRSGAYELDFSDEVDRLRGDARSVAGARGTEDRAALLDSLILCKFVRGAIDDFYPESAALLEAVTGFDYDEAELREVAHRIVTLRKAFNIREGWQPADDTLPERFLTEALTSGPAAGVRLPRERLEAMIQQYNRERGWDVRGYPYVTQLAPLFEDLDLTFDLDRYAEAKGDVADASPSTARSFAETASGPIPEPPGDSAIGSAAHAWNSRTGGGS